jgi:hypothetical protein
MSTLTVYSSTADGYIYSSNTSYSTARSTASLSDNSSTTVTCGQDYSSPKYHCYESFFSFDTSSLGGAATVSSATLSLYGYSDQSNTDFTATAAIKDWGSSLDTSDWVAGANLSSLTTVATYNPASGWSTTGYNNFADVALPANINKTGTTYLILYSDRHAAGNTPTGYEYVNAYSADQSGTSQDPKLVVEYSYPGLLPVTRRALQAVNRAASW